MTEAAYSVGGSGALVALLLFIAGSLYLGDLAQKIVERGSFLKGFFIGNRALGAWAMALTATVQSGGTFMGFPSLIYSHGWVIALWVAGYMVVPVTGFAILGKRLAQMSRRLNALTIPELLRERYGNPTVGLVASLLLMVFLSIMLMAQFKAGALIIEACLPPDVKLFFVDPASDSWVAKNAVYLAGLILFATTVVAYTASGGFLAAVWTDLFQSLLMLAGVLILLPLALYQAGGLARATEEAVLNTGPAYVSAPGFVPDHLAQHTEDWQFMPLGMAFSFFVIWVFIGFGSPASMVRVMAAKDSATLRRSIVLLNFYNLLIYLPLIFIAVAAHAVLPEKLNQTDRVIPAMAIWTTRDLPLGSFVAGLILAAPFGAVMSTVSSYLVVIASGLVQDVYHRLIRPGASEGELRRLSHAVMILIGVFAVTANIWPVRYLQALVVLSGTTAAATFLVPVALGAFWKKATAWGALAAMLAGAGAMSILYGYGWALTASGQEQKIGLLDASRPYYLFGFDPFVWGLTASLVAGVVVSRLTVPPGRDVLAKVFPEAAPQPEP